MPGMFDDLVPNNQNPANMPLNFDDLIPNDQGRYNQTLEGARKAVLENPATAAMGGVLNSAQAIPYVGTFTDEAGSALGAIPSLVKGGFKGYGEDYEQRQRNQQALRQATAEQTGVAGTLIPQLVTGTGFAMAMPGPKEIPAGFWPAVGQGAAQGAGMGVAYGAGEGDASKTGEDSFAGRIGNALLGSLGGSVAGGVVGGAGNRLVKALNPEVKAAPEIKAASLAMQNDQTAPDELSQALQDRAMNMGKSGWTQAGMPTTIGDVGGPNTQTLAENVAQRPGAGMADAARMLEERNTSAPVRSAAIIEEHIAPLDYLQKMQDTQEAMGGAAVKQGYKQAYDAVPKLNSPEINQAVDRLTADPLGQRVWKNANLMAQREGQTFGNVDATGNIRSLGTSDIDFLKKSADDLIGARVGVEGNMTKSELRFLTNVKNQMVGAMDAANPAYAVARKTFGDPASVKTAMEEGRDLLSSKDWHEVWQEYKNAPEIEKNGLLSGVASKVAEMLKAQGGENPLAKAGNDARQFIMNPEVRTRLETILGKDEASSMIERLGHEASGGDFANRILRNSATARRQFMEEALNKQSQTGLDKIGPFAKYAANFRMGDPASWVGMNPQSLEAASKSASDASRTKLNEGLAKLLLNTNTSENVTALHKIASYGSLSATQKQALAAALANQSKYQGPASAVGRMLMFQDQGNQ